MVNTSLLGFLKTAPEITFQAFFLLQVTSAFNTSGNVGCVVLPSSELISGVKVGGEASQVQTCRMPKRWAEAAVLELEKGRKQPPGER